MVGPKKQDFAMWQWRSMGPLKSEDNDLIWNEQGFPPEIQRAGLTTVDFTEEESLYVCISNTYVFK